MKAIFVDCYREMKSRKISFIFGGVTLLSVFIGFATSNSSFSITMNNQSADNLSDTDAMLGNPVLNSLDMFLTVLVFLAVMALAGRFPYMMQKGRADYYLSKPISRDALFFDKFASIYVIYGSLIILSGMISYSAFTLINQIHGFSVLWILLSQMTIFLVWLAIVSLVGIISGSGGMAIMAAFIIWFAQRILTGHEEISAFVGNESLSYVLAGLYYLLPKTSQLSEIGVNMAAGATIEDWLPLWSSILFALCSYWLGLYKFRRTDY